MRHQRSSEVIMRHQRSLEVIMRQHASSCVNMRHHASSEVITCMAGGMYALETAPSVAAHRALWGEGGGRGEHWHAAALHTER